MRETRSAALDFFLSFRSLAAVGPYSLILWAVPAGGMSGNLDIQRAETNFSLDFTHTARYIYLVVQFLSVGRQAVTNREFHQRRQILDIELRHQPAAVGVDALGRQAETFRDLGTGAAIDDQAQHLALARA